MAAINGGMKLCSCVAFDVLGENERSQTLIVSSGSLICADNFSLVYMSAYRLLQNSGGREAHVNIDLGVRMQSSLVKVLLFVWLVRQVVVNAPCSSTLLCSWVKVVRLRC